MHNYVKRNECKKRQVGSFVERRRPLHKHLPTFFGIHLKKLLIAKLCFMVLTTSVLAKKLNVVTSSSDLASIAKEVGGDRVRVQSLAAGSDNLHFLPARPDFILKVNQADILLAVGADLEVGWLPLVIQNARNPKVQEGLNGFCDLSQSIKLLQRRLGQVDRQMGDIHPFGNPHYWIDPVNGIRMAKYIAGCFSQVDAKNKTFYQKNFKKFSKRAKALTKKLFKLMRPFRGTKVIGYHAEFVYLTVRFHLEMSLNIEEMPGVLPGPARIKEVTKLAKQNKVKLVLTTPWNDIGIAKKVAKDAGINFLVLPMQTGSAPGTETYLKMVEKCVRLLANKLR